MTFKGQGQVAYIHALTYMSHLEMLYTKVHESKPLQSIHELEAKAVNLSPKTGTRHEFSINSKITGHAPGSYLNAN